MDLKPGRTPRALQIYLSNEKILGCLGYIEEYTTQLCGDYNNKP